MDAGVDSALTNTILPAMIRHAQALGRDLVMSPHRRASQNRLNIRRSRRSRILRLLGKF
jgi:hypothetical protein